MSAETEREKYLEALKTRLRARQGGASEAVLTPVTTEGPRFALVPEPVVEDAPTPDVAQPSPYSESAPLHTVEAFHDRVVARHDLDQIAKALSIDSLETLVIVARRLARAEERTC